MMNVRKYVDIQLILSGTVLNKYIKYVSKPNFKKLTFFGEGLVIIQCIYESTKRLTVGLLVNR